MTTVQQPSFTESDTLLRRMLDTIVAFQALLIEEQQAIRSLSFGQFTMVTMRKSHLLDELRTLEHRRRAMSPNAGNHPFPPASQQETELVLAIEQTDRLNRINGALIGQSLEFLEGTLRLWQHSPASAALYSSSGTPVPAATHRVRTIG